MSLRSLIKIAVLTSTCLVSVNQALAENRMALVIGNSSYTSVTALPNPGNDAKAVTKFLSSAGFQVLQVLNLTQSEMRQAISNFASMVSEKGPDTVALVFYAGHGVQVDGENFLIPVDARIERESDVPLQAMRLVDLMNVLSSIPSKSNIVILDACRNNPFSAINKTSGRGLAKVDAPKGTLVSYSTAPGTEALDGDTNSPFTTALLQIGQEPGLPIEMALKRVRLAVTKATDPQQVPYESSSLTTEFSFFPTQSGQERPILVKAEQSSTKAGRSRETEISRSEIRSVDSWRNELRSKPSREAYEFVISENKPEAYQAYLTLYPSQPMTPVVRTIYERQKVMLAWYSAVTINTVASYQTFLASHGSSDFATTANRLFERALTRSVPNAGSAFASVPTCPCSQQPTNPAPLRKRTNLAPTQNHTSNPGHPGGTNLVVINPSMSPVPPIVVTPPNPPIVRIPPHREPPWTGKRPRGNDNPPKSTGNDPKNNGGSTGNRQTHDNRRVMPNKTITTTKTVHSLTMPPGLRTPSTSVVQQRGMIRNSSPGMKMGGTSMGRGFRH